MTYRPKGSIQIRLTEHELWIAHPNYDRILEEMELVDRPAHSPLSYRTDRQLETIDAYAELDPLHYQVAFTLGSPFNNPAQEDVDILGDSLLEFGRTVQYVTMQGETRHIRLALVPNHLYHLARIVAFIPVDSVDDGEHAEDWAFTVVRPFLSQLSALYQVPLETTLVEHFLFEPPKTVKYARRVITPYKAQQVRMADVVQLHKLNTYDTFFKAVGHYREGANSWSPLHRFLSWFKATEALFALQDELAQDHPGLRFNGSVVADSYASRLLCPDYIGKSHKVLLERYLTKPHRHAVAHWGRKTNLQESHDHNYGLVLYYNLCLIVEDAFQGVLSATREAIQQIA